MKTIVNARYPLFVTLGFAIGIVLTVSIIYGQLLVAILVPIGLIAPIVFSCLKKKFKLFKVSIVLLASVLLSLTLSIFNFFSYQSNQIGSQEGTLRGYTTDSVYRSDNFLAITLSDCVFTNTAGQTYKLSNVNLSMLLYEFFDGQGNLVFDYSVGNYITARGTISDTYIFKDRVDTYNYKNNVFHEFSAVTEIYSKDVSPTLAQSCRLYIKNTFMAHMPNNADIAYALFVGDKSLMVESDLQSFRDAGIAHLLAVSGLHVGFVAAIFIFVLDRLKASKYVRLFAVLLPLTFYAYICGFSPSVVRAVVMTAVALICKCLNVKTDLLNSLSLAGLLILAVRPFYLFDAGFLLSFFAVFGIATFATQADRFLRNKKIFPLLKTFLQAVFVSVGTTLSTLPFVAYFFGRISLLGVFSNLVAIPLVTVGYIVTFVGLVPYLQFILFVPNFLFGCLRSFASFVAGIPFSAVNILSLGILTAVALYSLLFVFGGFVNIKGRLKAVVCILLAVVVVVWSIFCLIPVNTQFQVYIADSYSECLLVLCDNQNTAYIIGNLQSKYDIVAIENHLAGKRVNQVQLFVYNFSKLVSENTSQLSEKFNLTKVYIFDSTGNDAVEHLLTDITFIRVPPNFSTNGNIEVGSVYDGALTALVVKMPNVSFAISLSNHISVVQNLQYTLPADIEFIFSFNLVEQIAGQFDKIPIICTQQYDAHNIYALSKYGNFTIRQSSDIMQLRQIT